MATKVGLKRKMTPEERQKVKDWAAKHGKIIIFKDGEVFDGRKAKQDRDQVSSEHEQAT